MERTTNPTPNPHAAEVAHDERLLELFAAQHVAWAKLDKQRAFSVQTAAREVGWRSGYVGRRFTYMVRDESGAAPFDREARLSDAEPVLRALGAEPDGHRGINRPLAEDGRERLAKLDEARAAVSSAREAIEAHETGYTGWSRYVLVTSSAGHVHRNMECSTCRPTTTYCPVPSLSGSTEAEAVAALGETLCTVCFPSAPVKPSKVTQAQAIKLLEDGEAAFLAMRAKAAGR